MPVLRCRAVCPSAGTGRCQVRGHVPPDPDRSVVFWKEEPHLSPERAVCRKVTGRLFVAERSSPRSEVVALSTTSLRIFR
jgi:hypothetical protein